MSLSFKDYVFKQLSNRVADRKIVVWYDRAGSFQPFIDDLSLSPKNAGPVNAFVVDGKQVSVIQYAGSFLAVRLRVESMVSADKPSAVVVYVPVAEHDPEGSVLMELEKAGSTWKPELKDLGRKWLTPSYTAGVLDELFRADRAITYDDIAKFRDDEASATPSVIKTIFNAKSSDALIAAWLAQPEHDDEIASKGAVSELAKLLAVRLPSAAIPDAGLEKMRAIVLRFVLATEFRLDLSCDAPTALAGVPVPVTKDEGAAARAIAAQLRGTYAALYPELADRVESELNLSNVVIAADRLGSIDTFRFEERALLAHACSLIANGQHYQAESVIADREHSFWLDRDVARKAQWEAVRYMADLAALAVEVAKAVKKAPSGAAEWLKAYSDDWYRMDQAQRRLEAWVANLDEEPDERALGVVRRAYHDTCVAMAEGFSRAVVAANWNIPNAAHQTDIWNDCVAGQPRPVAYVLVDAMRYEMGQELADRLPRSSEVSLRSALGALPSLTPVGMAALLPGASSSFSVVAQNGKFGVRIEDGVLSDLAGRIKHLAARIPLFVDISLDELLGLSAAKLVKKLEGAEVIVVRSQEIDAAGEAGFVIHARQAMDTMIDNLIRAIRKLSIAGVERAVIAADHGHLFFANPHDDAMKIDPPGGEAIGLHRRCWIGRGGTTPPGCVRVSASSLGYDSDLDFVFPAGLGVFRAGGGLAYHHGGMSLQELVVPVISVVTKSAKSAVTKGERITASGLPRAITNRIFSVELVLGDVQQTLGAAEVQVQGLLIANGKQVGALGMAVDAPFDRARGVVTLVPGVTTTVAFLLTDESVKTLRVVVLDPTTDAELYRSPDEIPVALGV